MMDELRWTPAPMTTESAERIVDLHRTEQPCPFCRPPDLCPAYLEAAMFRLSQVGSTTDTSASHPTPAP